MIKEFHVSKNLCPTAWEQGSIDSTTGNDTQSNSEIRSDYISVFPNGVFSIKRTIATAYVKIRLYDSSKNYLGTGTDNTTLIYGGQGSTAGNPMQANQDFCCVQIVNPNAYYMRIVDTSNDLSTLYMFTEGNYTPSTMIPYEPYGDTWNTKSYAKSITGAQTYTKFPIVLRTTDQSIPTWSVKGNTSTSGTPSPSNPITISGVGERTSNIIEGYIADCIMSTNGQITSNSSFDVYYAAVTSGDKYTIKYADSASYIVGYFTAKPSMGSTTYNGDISINSHSAGEALTVTVPNGVAYLAVRVPKGQSLMVNEGETALPYEMWGYKIPITNGGVTTNIYLGSTQSTRQIKKLVLTGDETYSWSRSTSYSGGFFTAWSNVGGKSYEMFYCSHAQYVSDITDYVNGTCYSDGSLNIRIMPEGSTVTQWRAYLAQQYAAGTPVTVWYVLATEETGIVNEPLMKIGTYADTLSNATSIPTTSGLNTIDVDTTVKPSEMSLTYDGYKLCKGQRYVGGVVNKFDESTFISDAERSGQTGEVIPNSSGYGTSELIPVESGKTLYFSQNGTASAPTYLYTYQSNGTFIQRLVGSNTYDVPNNCGYVAICIHRTKLSKYQIQYDEVTEYHPYYEWV